MKEPPEREPLWRQRLGREQPEKDWLAVKDFEVEQPWSGRPGRQQLARKPPEREPLWRQRLGKQRLEKQRLVRE